MAVERSLLPADDDLDDDIDQDDEDDDEDDEGEDDEEDEEEEETWQVAFARPIRDVPRLTSMGLAPTLAPI